MADARIVTIFGGSGFVGRYVAQRMARAGWRVRVAVRRPNEALFVKPYGVVGQVEPIQANLRDDASCRAAIAGADAVINCVGILFESGPQRFDAVHAQAAGRIARLSAEAGAKHLVHLSAIGADANSESAYCRSKADGEAAVLAAFPTAAILRPSIIFGNEDQFFNRFAAMTPLSPLLPIVGAATRFQPVFVDDVAAAAAVAVTETHTGIYELGGPEIASFRELMERMLRVIRRTRPVINLPVPLARIIAGTLDLVQFLSGGLLANRMITRDQVASLGVDNIVSDNAKTLADLGITPQSMDGILETYLYSFRPQGQYTALTESAENLKS